MGSHGGLHRVISCYRSKGRCRLHGGIFQLDFVWLWFRSGSVLVSAAEIVAAYTKMSAGRNQNETNSIGKFARRPVPVLQGPGHTQIVVPVSPYTWVFNEWFLGRPAVVDFWAQAAPRARKPRPTGGPRSGPPIRGGFWAAGATGTPKHRFPVGPKLGGTREGILHLSFWGRTETGHEIAL